MNEQATIDRAGHQVSLRPGIDARSERVGLTRRETEVLAWVAEGKSNQVIGLILAISPRTVQKHLERIFAKLGVESRTSAAVWAVSRQDAGQGVA